MPLIILSVLRSRSQSFSHLHTRARVDCANLSSFLKLPPQYSHLETFCSSPPASSALAYVTAAVMSKLIANNLLPQVRIFRSRTPFIDLSTSSLLVIIARSSTTLVSLDCPLVSRPRSLDGNLVLEAGHLCPCLCFPRSSLLSMCLLTPVPPPPISLEMIQLFVLCRCVCCLGPLVNAFVGVKCLSCSTSAPFFIRLCQEVRLDLEKALRSDAHQLVSHLLSDALARHTWSIQQQLAVIDNAECPAASRGSEACIHAAFQNSMLQHMDSCFGFNLGSKPAPSISLRSLSVGSVSSETAVHISRAFITGYIMVSLCCAS
jgi:hypothetical protein